VAAQYHFKTEWDFKADLPRAWSVVLDLQHYPEWWRDFRLVRLLKGDGHSIGSAYECVVRGSLPYSLRYAMEVVEAERHRRIVLSSTGDLVGTGRWEFFEPAPGQSRAIYYWDVGTTNAVLNLITPVVRPVLARNHERVMANGYRALRPRIENA